MASQSPRFQRFTHPCMDPDCRAQHIQISYALSKDRPTVLESDAARCLVCGSTYSIRLGEPEPTGVRVHIKLV